MCGLELEIVIKLGVPAGDLGIIFAETKEAIENGCRLFETAMPLAVDEFSLDDRLRLGVEFWCRDCVSRMTWYRILWAMQEMKTADRNVVNLRVDWHVDGGATCTWLKGNMSWAVELS